MTLATVPRYERGQISRVGERAVVVGASMAGLLAGRVLADGFDEVVVLERDRFPDEPAARRGVPQANHVHVMLEAGRATLEDLFPGYGERLLSSGALVIDGSSDIRHYDHGGFLADGPKRLPMYCASRPLFERIVREGVADLDSVTLRSECQFTDYLVSDDGNAVEGVVATEEGDEVTYPAELVVDATGRASKTPQWLERHGYASPATDEVEIDLAYATTTVERPPGDRHGFLLSPSPPRTRGGTAIPIEGGRWVVTLFGLHGDHPPGDPEGFREFAGSLPISGIRSLLDDHDWLSESIHRYPFNASVRRRYEDLDRFPDGLVVTGDAIASFNPVYGQGMSVAALDALALHHALAAGGRADLATRFFDRVGDVVESVWQIGVNADFAFPQTEGQKPRGASLMNRYLSRLIRTAHTDRKVAGEFARVLQLEQSPESLMAPGILWRVLLPTSVRRNG